MSDDIDEREAQRRARRAEIDAMPGAVEGDIAERAAWFEHVYESAHHHPEQVPWADLKPKDVLVNWLKRNPGEGRTALDVACGLGDNAEAIAAAGWKTSAFDVAPHAIEWAESRFPKSPVSYSVANLFHPPAEWIGGFDLVHECYTLQSFSGEMREDSFAAVARLVKPGGRLLVIARARREDEEVPGPPFPLTPGEFDIFRDLGFLQAKNRTYVVQKGYRLIAHRCVEYRRTT